MRYPVARSAAHGAAVLVLSACSALGLCAWLATAEVDPLAALPAGGAWLACTALALAGWLQAPRGHLQWNGQAWSWAATASPGDPEAGSLQPVADLQYLLLLRWTPASAGTWRPAKRAWLWLAQGHDPARWGDLRRAVYSSANSAATPGDAARPTAASAGPSAP